MKQSTNLSLLNQCHPDCLLAKNLFPFDGAKV